MHTCLCDRNKLGQTSWIIDADTVYQWTEQKLHCVKFSSSAQEKRMCRSGQHVSMFAFGKDRYSAYKKSSYPFIFFHIL